MPFSPTDLSNLWAWYKADAGVTGTGNNVSAWADQSGNGRDLGLDVPGNKLKLVASAINGYPAIATLGTPGNGSDWGAFKTADQITATDVTIYVVGKQRAETGFFPYFVSVADGFIICRNGNDAVWFQGDNYSQNPIEIDADDNVFYSLRLRITSGTDYYATINNAIELHDIQTQQPNPGYFYVFGAVDADKEIAEIIIYSESHNSTNRSQVESYLQQKYNLPYSVNNSSNNSNYYSMEVQGNDIIILLREAGSEDAYRKMVCEIDNSFKLTNDVTEKDTKCGTKVGIKPPKGNISGNATHNISPTVFEVSYEDVADWQLNSTLLEYKYVNAEFTDDNGDTIEEGDVVYFAGNAYFIDSEYKGATGEVGEFSFSLKPTTISNVIASS